MSAAQYQIQTLPFPYLFYLKAVTGKRSYKEGQAIPRTRITWDNFRFDKPLVESYAKLTEWTFDGRTVPLLFPHSYFGPLHLQMLTDEGFPLRVLGGIHLRNHVLQKKALLLDEEYSADLVFTAQRRRPQGLEVDFKTEILKGGEVHWESLTTFLFRRKFKSEDAESPLGTLLSNSTDLVEKANFPVPMLMGKQFGWLTKDINPIHMSRILAKIFGFERDLCHGMWALSRSLPLVGGIDWTKPVRNDVWFKGPLYMQRDVTIKVCRSHPELFELFSQGNDRPCVLAKVQNVSSSEKLS